MLIATTLTTDDDYYTVTRYTDTDDGWTGLGIEKNGVELEFSNTEAMSLSRLLAEKCE